MNRNTAATLSYDKLDLAFWRDGGAALGVDATFQSLVDKTHIPQDNDISTQETQEQELIVPPTNPKKMRTMASSLIEAKTYMSVLNSYKHNSKSNLPTPPTKPQSATKSTSAIQLVSYTPGAN